MLHKDLSNDTMTAKYNDPSICLSLLDMEPSQSLNCCSRNLKLLNSIFRRPYFQINSKSFAELLWCDDELFCGMVDRRKAFSLISSRDHCQRSSPPRISDTPGTEFEPA